MEKIDVYRPSGDMGTLALPMGLVGGLVAAGGLGWIYQAAVDWIPLIYLNFIATIGLGFGIGWVVAAGLRKGDCRSPAAAVVVALVCACAAVAASFHFAYEREVANGVEQIPPDLADMVEDEEIAALLRAGKTEEAVRRMYPFGDYLDDRVESGWTIGRSEGLQVSGIFVWLIWILELGTVAFTAVLLPVANARKPFCEACTRWLDHRDIGEVRRIDSGELQAAVRDGTLAPILAPVQSDKAAGESAAYALDRCGGCDARYVSVELKKTVPSKKGEDKEESEGLLECAAVTPEQADAVQAHLKELRRK